jgi:hypothetical protein
MFIALLPSNGRIYLLNYASFQLSCHSIYKVIHDLMSEFQKLMSEVILSQRCHINIACFPFLRTEHRLIRSSCYLCVCARARARVCVCVCVLFQLLNHVTHFHKNWYERYDTRGHCHNF